MKAKSGFILRSVMDEFFLMPVGENLSAYHGAVLMNRVSAYIWEQLQTPVSREDLLAAVLQRFDVDETQATADMDRFLDKLDQLGIIES